MSNLVSKNEIPERTFPPALGAYPGDRCLLALTHLKDMPGYNSGKSVSRRQCSRRRAPALFIPSATTVVIVAQYTDGRKQMGRRVDCRRSVWGRFISGPVRVASLYKSPLFHRLALLVAAEGTISLRGISVYTAANRRHRLHAQRLS